MPQHDNQTYQQLKRAILQRRFSHLNPMQRQPSWPWKAGSHFGRGRQRKNHRPHPPHRLPAPVRPRLRPAG